MLQQDGDEVDGDDGDGVVDDGDDDPDEVQRDDDDDRDNFPSPGGNFPGRISLDGFRPVEALEFFVDDPPILGFPWGRYTRKGNPQGGPRRPHPSWARSHLGPCRARVWGPPGSPRHLLVACSVFLCSKTPEKVFRQLGFR